MVAAIYSDLPEGSAAVVFKDAPRRHYLASYLTTYGDMQELRAYRVTFRNVLEFGDLETVDELLADGQHAEAFDGLISMMLVELGSQYVSDVNLDGIHDDDVAVGTGHLRDRFHRDQFAGHAEAEAAYLSWLTKAFEHVGGGG